MHVSYISYNEAFVKRRNLLFCTICPFILENKINFYTESYGISVSLKTSFVF